MSRYRPLAIALAAALWLGACSAVPDIVYVDEIEAGPPPVDANVPDAARDTSVGADATPDAPVGEGCPTKPPAYATTCCGTVPCAGECATQCSACASACGSGEACCAKRNNVVCRPRDGFTCN